MKPVLRVNRRKEEELEPSRVQSHSPGKNIKQVKTQPDIRPRDALRAISQRSTPSKVTLIHNKDIIYSAAAVD